jgi:asparagine N-glycosylation enzyme membrane subunit Stt3
LRKQAFGIDNNLIFALLVIAILIICIYVRLGLMQYQGLFEPDGFMYYTAMKQAVSQGYVLQNNTVNLSGYPWHNLNGEAHGLIYFTLVPYAVLQYFGASILDVMRAVPILFGVLSAIGAYFVARYLTKSRILGLIAMFFIATSSGNVARTAGTVYRGDSFIGTFVLLALLLMLMALYESRERRMYLLALGAAFVIGISNVVWNGGSLTLGVFLVSVILVFLYGAISGNEAVLKKNLLILGAVLLGYLLENFFIFLRVANTTNMTVVDFVLIFSATLIADVLAIFLLRIKSLSPFIGSIWKRLAILCVLLVVVVAVIYVIAPAVFTSLLSLNGIVANNNIGYTTQELQKPTLDFLTASFGAELFLAPLGVLLFILFAHKANDSTSKVTFKGGLFGINANYAFALFLAYLLFTSYLQDNAIRYNALVSVPIAIFAAYAIYIIGKMIKPYVLNLGRTRLPMLYFFIGLVTVIFLYQAVLTAQQSFSSVQADGINPQFLQAAAWLNNNTAANATVLALWPDGSVVEGVGNRQSFMDSVYGENGTRIIQFARDFLFNTTPASGYLINEAHRPDYILVRSFWFAELGGIAIEGNITGSNLANYGFDQFTQFSSGGTYANQTYTFANSNYVANLFIRYSANGSRQIGAVLSLAAGSNAVPFAHILFINQSNGQYQILNHTGNTTAANYTLFVSYYNASITSAVLLGSGLPNTNLFKLLIECNRLQCAYNVPGSRTQMRLVYQNSDSKIFAINYT